jgi:hypothetical protein
MIRARRERRIRLVLAVGCLTALATSPAEDHVRSDEGTVELDPDGSARVEVRASDTAHREAEGFEVVFSAHRAFDVDATIRIVPDDERLPTHELRLAPREVHCITCAGSAALDAALEQEDGGDVPGVDDDAGGVAGRAPDRAYSVDVMYEIEHEQCPERGDCELRFTLQRMDEPAAPQGIARVRVHAQVVRGADGRLFCGENRDFNSGATVEVTIDD